MSLDKKVDFFIVGQPKSGTSALANFLDQHPAICMANPKEPGYFAKDHLLENEENGSKGSFLKAKTMADYERHFRHCQQDALLGEATTTYLYSKVAAQEIFSYNPHAKIIIMLRNPVDFLHSLHMQHVNDGSEDELSFEEALKKEFARKQGQDLPRKAPVPSHLFYSERVKYGEQIERFQRLFPKKNILILTAEDFQEDNLAVYKKVLRFLQTDENFIPELRQINGSAAPRSSKLHSALNTPALKKVLYSGLGPNNYSKVKGKAAKVVMKAVSRPPISEATRLKLQTLTYPEVKKVEKVTGLNLVSKWGYATYERSKQKELLESPETDWSDVNLVTESKY